MELKTTQRLDLHILKMVKVLEHIFEIEAIDAFEKSGIPIKGYGDFTDSYIKGRWWVFTKRN